MKDVLFPMFVSREKGEKFDTAKWISMVTAELGSQEKERFEKLIIDGSITLEPREDLFGPCFNREATVFQHSGKDIAGYRWVLKHNVKEATCAPIDP